MSIQESAAELNNIGEAVLGEPRGIVQQLGATLEEFQQRAAAALGDDSATHWQTVMGAYQQTAETRAQLALALHHFGEALKTAAAHHKGG